MLLATSYLGTVMIAVVFIALPLAAIMFANGADKRLDDIGKGDFAMDHDTPSSGGGSSTDSAADREEEIRQMIQARSDRGVAKGRNALNVDSEVKKVLDADGAAPGSGDPQLREEVRQLVVARNERRERAGKKPLNVEKEIDRQLRDLENLGQ